MHQDDAEWVRRIAGGARVTAADEPSAGYRTELLRLLVTFIDSELAGAAGLAGFINRAPRLSERITLARIVAEKLDHAREVLALVERFGLRSDLYLQSHAWDARLGRDLDLGTRRTGDDRRLNVFHYPLQSWEDVATQTMLMGAATVHQLGDLADCSYAPFAALVPGIVAREAAHADDGTAAMAACLAGPGSAAAAAAIGYWYPRVADTFGRRQPDGFERYRQYGLRRSSNAELLARWQQDAAARLAALGLAAPAAVP